MNQENEHKYDDIIHLPHHVSKKHPQMPSIDRAAQFAPFAALTGHEAAIKETERIVETRVELDENSKQILDEKLQMIKVRIQKRPEIIITYFEKDKIKDGGCYVTIKGRVKKIDEYEAKIVMDSGVEIVISDIFMVE